MRPVDALLGQFVRACAEGDTRRAMGDETLRWQKIGAIRKAAGSILLASILRQCSASGVRPRTSAPSTSATMKTRTVKMNERRRR